MKEQVKINILSSHVVESPFANGYCRKYRLELKYNNETFRFSYHDSVYAWQNNEKLDKMNALYCILSDNNCYESSRDEQDFLDQFGYNENDIYMYYNNNENLNYYFSSKEIKQFKQGLRAYKACEKTHNALYRIFTSDELERLYTEFEDY